MSVTIEKLFAVAGNHVEDEQKREQLMGLLQRYNRRECSKAQMQAELRTIVSRAKLKATLVECFPNLLRVAHERAQARTSELRAKKREREMIDHPSSSTETECKVCFTNEANCVLRPCGHLVMCRKCSMRSKKCPICRSSIRQRITCYRS